MTDRHVLQRKMPGVLGVGLAGAPCSGKTSLSLQLQDDFPHSVIIHQDMFYLDETSLKRSNGMYNWDDVESLDNRDLTRAVQQACLHPCVHCPQCDTQGSGDIHLVIVEGTMILALAELSDLLDTSIFLSLDKPTCQQRRVQHKYDGDPDPPGYFESCLWPAYLKMVDVAASHNGPGRQAERF